MLKKTYGLYYKNGRWFIRNYGRAIKTGKHGAGMGLWLAVFKAWRRNFRYETPIIDLKRIVPRPGPEEEYGSEWARDQRADQQVAKICDQICLCGIARRQVAGEAACAPRGDEQGQG